MQLGLPRGQGLQHCIDKRHIVSCLNSCLFCVELVWYIYSLVVMFLFSGWEKKKGGGDLVWIFILACWLRSLR